MEDNQTAQAEKVLRDASGRLPAKAAKEGAGNTLRLTLAWVLLTRGDRLDQPYFYKSALREVTESMSGKDDPQLY